MSLRTCMAAAFAAAACLAISPAAAQSKISGSYAIVTLPPGTTFNATAAAIAKLFNANTGARLRLREAGTQMEEIVSRNETEFGLGAGPASYDAYTGRGLYEGKPNRNLRTVLIGPTLFGSLMVTIQSGMTQTSDLKGKRVPGEFPGSRSFLEDTELALAAGGLTWKDVRVVPAAGVRENGQLFMDGITDAANGSLGAGFVSQADARHKGVRFLSLGKAGPELDARLEKFKFGYYSQLKKKGSFTGIVEDTTVWAKDIVVLASTETSADVVYEMAKVVWERVRELDGVHPAMATWTQDGMISTRIIAPMHEGSIRFLKEVGRWGGDLEKRHNALLAMHAKQ